MPAFDYLRSGGAQAKYKTSLRKCVDGHGSLGDKRWAARINRQDPCHEFHGVGLSGDEREGGDQVVPVDLSSPYEVDTGAL